MKTTNTRAQEVAHEMGTRCGWIAAENVWSVDCTESDFEEVLALLGPEMPNKFNRAAYDRLQNEGYGETTGQADPEDEFSTGRE